MGIIKNHWKSQQPQPLMEKLLPYVVYAILPVSLFTLYFYPFPHFPQSPDFDRFSHSTPISTTTTTYLTSSTSSTNKENEARNGALQPSSISHNENEGRDRVLQRSSSPNAKESRNGAFIPLSVPPKAQVGSVNEISQPTSAPANRKEPGNGVFPKPQRNEIPSVCDYTNGEWVRDKRGPLYNGTNCKTIKDGQNCMSHGRPDMGYLYWRWKPRDCNLPRFNPLSLMQILEAKHLAFVGDSMARNQLESLLCMLASFSPPNLVYSKGGDNKFRRWHFPSHNVTVSAYWSPFLVKGIEKDGERDYNKLYLDSVDERWASDLDSIDVVVLSIGHWYLLRGVYHDGNSKLGCHGLESLNCTEIGFYDVFGKAFNTTLKAIIQRKGSKGNGIDVIVTTFSPHHFEGEWDKFGACPKTEPYKEGEKALKEMDAEMRRLEIEEVQRAKAMLNADKGLPKVRLEALDVTKLALLRPDGHPGPYMYPFPFANGIKERVQNDCVHWCMPGPIDTWNQILLDVMQKWHVSSMR